MPLSSAQLFDRAGNPRNPNVSARMHLDQALSEAELLHSNVAASILSQDAR